MRRIEPSPGPIPHRSGYKQFNCRSRSFLPMLIRSSTYILFDTAHGVADVDAKFGMKVGTRKPTGPARPQVALGNHRTITRNKVGAGLSFGAMCRRRWSARGASRPWCVLRLFRGRPVTPPASPAPSTVELRIIGPAREGYLSDRGELSRNRAPVCSLRCARRRRP